MSFKEMIFRIAGILRKYSKQIILFVSVFFILIPIGINLAFKYNSGIVFLQAEWCASDALGFYGGLLAAGLGIYGVFLSIQYAQKNYRDDLKNQVLPYIVVTQLRGISRYNAFADGLSLINKAESTERSQRQIDEGLPLYEECKITRIYYVIAENEITNYIDLPQKYRPILEKQGSEWEAKTTGGYILQKRPYLSFPVEIENVGNGTAVYVRLGFNKNEDIPKYLPPIQLKPGETFYIHIFSALPLESIYGEYTLSIIYQDIYHNRYEQSFPFIAEKQGYYMDLNEKQVCREDGPNGQT